MFGHFLRCRRETITVLGQIFIELQSFGKEANRAKCVSKTVSVVAGTASVVLFVIAPVTGGTSAVGGTVLAGLSGMAAATSLGARVYQQIVEKGLLKKAQEALDAEQKVADRLHALAAVARDIAFIAADTATFVNNATRLGLMAAEEAGTFLQLSKAVQSARLAQITSIASKAVTVLRVASHGLIIVSISLDLMSLLTDIKNNKDGNYSKSANSIWAMAQNLTEEYYNIRTALTVINALEDEAYIV